MATMTKKRIKYKEPPMRFDPALRKFVPDLPQKPSGGKPNRPKDPWITIIIAAIIFIILIILFYYASKRGVYP